MVTIPNPYDCLGKWLKPSPLADVSHRILRFDALLLVTQCGRTIPLENVSKPVRGARYCEECVSLHRIQEQEKRNYLLAKGKSSYAATGK